MIKAEVQWLQINDLTRLDYDARYAADQVVSDKKRTPHGPADPDGSQKMFPIFNYNNKMCYYLRLFL